MAHKRRPDGYVTDRRHPRLVFARKLMPATSPEVQQAIKSEAAAINRLFHEQKHDNLIYVFTHAWLEPAKLHYCIDMELADLSLYDYINYVFHGGPAPSAMVFGDPFDPRFSSKECSELQRLHTAFVIGAHISNGLQFMHQNGHIHRDLKPQNGTYLNYRAF
jgi:serine/threonine protein kinase